MTNIKIEKKVINSHVKKTNAKLSNRKKASTSLFQTVRTAVQEMAEDKNALSIYKTDVDCDRSSVNKIIKISECSFVMDNINLLPSGWSVLHAIATSAPNIDNAILQDALNNGEINTKSKLLEIRNFFKVAAVPLNPSIAIKPQDVTYAAISNNAQKLISFSESDFTKAELGDLLPLIERLKKLGFEINSQAALSLAA